MPYGGFVPGWSSSVSMKLAAGRRRRRRRASSPSPRRGRRAGTCCPSSRGSGCRGARCRNVAAGQQPFRNQRPLAGRRVDAVEVGGRELLLVAEVGPLIPADSPLAVGREIQVPHRLVGEFHEPLRRHVERLAEGEVAILIRPHHLQRLHPVVVGVPDVDVGHFVGGLPGRGVGRRLLLLCAEEDALAVLAPSQSGAIADHPGLGEPFGLRRLEHHRRRHGCAVPERRTDVAVREQNVVLLAHLIDVASLQHGDGVAVVAPGQPVVALAVVVERRDAPVPRVEHEQAVRVLHGGVDGVGQQLARPVERDVAHAAKQLVSARCGGPAESCRRRAQRSPCGRARRLGAARRRRRRGRRAPAAAPARCRRRLAAAAPEEHVGGCRREGECSDVLPRPDLPGGEVAQLDPPGWRRGRRPAAASRPGLAPGGPGLCRRLWVEGGAGAASPAAAAARATGCVADSPPPDPPVPPGPRGRAAPLPGPPGRQSTWSRARTCRRWRPRRSPRRCVSRFSRCSTGLASAVGTLVPCSV